ncbi:lymphocyte antigen 6 complex locus protein G5c, partial [Tursiops truncatus]|uniref:lymphocyte antigen 6 complex locus protein G5c n=1 Tax=Tursiops truncatus TaxID=9739 RepID=UPI003CCFC28D
SKIILLFLSSQGSWGARSGVCFPLVFLLSRPPFLACLRQFLPIFRISTPRPDDSWIVLGTQQGTLGQGPAPNLQTGSWSRWSVPGSRGLPLAHRPLKQKPCVSHRETDLARCRRSRHGEFERYDQEPLHQIHLNKYLSCYRCLLETKELGCLLGSDICLAPKGSSCMTLLIENNSGSEIVVSDCRSKEQKSDRSYTHTPPVLGF